MASVRHPTDVRQATDVPLDAHLHTDLSPDSTVPIDVYAAEAVRRGIAELAITDHVDFDERDPAYGYADFSTRERTVREAAERWAGQVTIRLGVEVTYQQAHEATIRRYLKEHPYDYTIGSVHVDADSPYTRQRVAGFVAGKSLADAVAPYFEEVVAAVRSGLFDTLGHLDYVKRYLADAFPAAAFAAAPEVYEPALRELAASGMALEVNSSGLRHRPGEPYPAAWAVERYRELGGVRVTAGSDAHAADHFAFGLEQAYDQLARAGFDRVGAGWRRGEERALSLPQRFRPDGAAARRDDQSPAARSRRLTAQPSSRYDS